VENIESVSGTLRMLLRGESERGKGGLWGLGSGIVNECGNAGRGT
jgi:hypothetical protein